LKASTDCLRKRASKNINVTVTALVPPSPSKKKNNNSKGKLPSIRPKSSQRPSKFNEEISKIKNVLASKYYNLTSYDPININFRFLSHHYYLSLK
jgi:hypothetical protein